jgi:membrane fusion protein, multidrug efflux system
MHRIKNILISVILSAFALSANADYLNEKIVLFPIHKAELSSIIDSTIEKYNFKEGENFKKEDVLVELDSNLYKQLFLKSKADLLRTQEAYKYTDKVYKHNKTLYKKDAVGEQELEESKLNMIKALADYEQAKANFQIASVRLNSCKIKAPFPGRIISKIENEYDYVREGQPIIEIADDSQLLAVMNIPSNMIENIHSGDKLTFTIDELKCSVTGKVYSVSGSINPGSRTFEIKAVIDNSNKKLRIGMSGKLTTTLK